MIKHYKFLPDAVQYGLHELVMDFFNRIEFESGPYNKSFLGGTLGMLAERHKAILGKPCETIYDTIKGWPLKDRTLFFNTIRQSNNIEEICEGRYLPSKIDNKATGIWETIRDFFTKLYTQVLDGDPFNELYDTNLRQHFDDFSTLNSKITLCPICGIGELKKKFDKNRDQYDHYLPISLYPLSSINFKNLIPICIECNSKRGKGDQDTIAVSSGKLFNIYDENHKGITIEFNIKKDSHNIDEIEWEIVYRNPDNKNDEIISWRNIYLIDERYIGHIKPRVEKWYSHYYSFITSTNLKHMSMSDKREACFTFLELDVTYNLAFIRKPALEAFLDKSLLARAEILAKFYS